jgi:hypothetical protein
LILNQVASVAEAVDDMALGTAKGPMRLGPRSRVVSAASTMTRVEGPPDPMMMPVRSWEMSPSSSPASRIAWSMATWFQAVPLPWKRMARRSTISSGLRLGAPWTWQRKP